MNIKQTSTQNTYTSGMTRVAELAHMGESLFHINDLATIWGIGDKHRLRVTIKRYVDAGLLFRIFRGFYSLRPLSEIDARILGQATIRSYVYMSCETVLADAGVIAQGLDALTYVSDHTSHFTLRDQRYNVRKLKDACLYHTAGIETTPTGLRVATLERAVADMLYFNVQFYFDGESLIHWEHVRALAALVGYPLTAYKRYV